MFLNVAALDLWKNVLKNKRESVHFSTVVGLLPATLSKNEAGETATLGKLVRFDQFSMSNCCNKQYRTKPSSK